MKIVWPGVDGRGVPQDDVEAVRLFRLAAAQGDARAQFTLGVMYANGRSVPQDDVQAHMWTNLWASRMSAGEERERAVKNRSNFERRSHHSSARKMGLRRGLNYLPRPRFTTLFFSRGQLAADTVQVVGRMDVEIEISLTKVAEICRRQLDRA